MQSYTPWPICSIVGGGFDGNFKSTIEGTWVKFVKILIKIYIYNVYCRRKSCTTKHSSVSLAKDCVRVWAPGLWSWPLQVHRPIKSQLSPVSQGAPLHLPSPFKGNGVWNLGPTSRRLRSCRLRPCSVRTWWIVSEWSLSWGVPSSPVRMSVGWPWAG